MRKDEGIVTGEEEAYMRSNLSLLETEVFQLFLRQNVPTLYTGNGGVSCYNCVTYPHVLSL